MAAVAVLLLAVPLVVEPTPTVVAVPASCAAVLPLAVPVPAVVAAAWARGIGLVVAAPDPAAAATAPARGSREAVLLPIPLVLMVAAPDVLVDPLAVPLPLVVAALTTAGAGEVLVVPVPAVVALTAEDPAVAAVVLPLPLPLVAALPVVAGEGVALREPVPEVVARTAALGVAVDVTLPAPEVAAEVCGRALAAAETVPRPDVAAVAWALVVEETAVDPVPPVAAEPLLAVVGSRYPDHRLMQERVRAARTRSTVIGGATSFGTVVLLEALRYGDARRRPWPTGQPAWLNALAAVLLITGAVIVVAAIANALRSGRARANRRSPLLALTTRQRRRVRRQALGQEPALPADMAFLRIVATRASKPDQVVALAVGAVPLMSGLAVLTVQPLRTMSALLAAFQVVASVSLLRRPAHARAFLRDHPFSVEFGNR